MKGREEKSGGRRRTEQKGMGRRGIERWFFWNIAWLKNKDPEF